MALVSLYQFFTTSLIKKGGGLWPDDTLATSSGAIRKTGANSILQQCRADKSDA